MQFQTIWQPSYTPSGFATSSQPRTECKVRCSKDEAQAVLAYLQKHGITEKTDLMKNMGLSSNKLRHAMEPISGLLDHEQSGAGVSRVCRYWAKSHPPAASQRCTSYQVYDWIVRHPWSTASEIPAKLIPVAQKRRMCCLSLVLSGKVISRERGARNEYRAVV